MKIKIHFTVILLIGLSLFTGNGNKLFIMFTVMTMHELGHIFGCIVFKRELYKLTIIPFGGILQYNIDKNKELYEEFIIYILGPLMNLLLMTILNILEIYNDWYLFNKYVFMINILPILPLDGGRIIEVIFSDIFSFKRSLIINNIFTLFLNLFLLIILYFNIDGYNYLMIAIFLFIENIKSYLGINKRHFSFLLKKYTNLNKKLNKKVINSDSVDKVGDIFYKGKYNIINNNNKFITEGKYLKNKFEKN